MQAAEAFVREEAGLSGVEDLHFLSAHPEGAGGWRVRFGERASGLVHEAYVVRRTSDFSNPITCHSAEPKPVSQYHLGAHRVLPGRDTTEG